MNDRHRVVMRARIRYERRKHEHSMDGFVKALYPVFKAAATTIKQWSAAFQGQKSASDEGRAGGETYD